MDKVNPTPIDVFSCKAVEYSVKDTNHKYFKASTGAFYKIEGDRVIRYLKDCYGVFNPSGVKDIDIRLVEPVSRGEFEGFVFSYRTVTELNSQLRQTKHDLEVIVNTLKAFYWVAPKKGVKRSGGKERKKGLYRKHMNELFPIETKEGLTCRSCEHRQRWECNSKIIQYCGVRKSNRTDNGLLKIKCKDQACVKYKEM